MSASNLLQKVKGTMASAMRDNDVIDLDTLNSEIGDIEAGMGADSKEGDDEEYDVADKVGNTRNRPPLRHRALNYVIRQI